LLLQVAILFENKDKAVSPSKYNGYLVGRRCWSYLELLGPT